MESEKSNRTTTDKVGDKESMSLGMGEAEIAVRLLKDGFCNRTMSRINAIMQQEVFALIKSAELAFRECLESMINARREDGKPALDPSVADKIAAHYEHAKAKHPYFADTVGWFDPDEKDNAFRQENVRSAHRYLSYKRGMLEHSYEIHNVRGTAVLECEIGEIEAAIAMNDKDHAVEECYDAIALLLRMVDVLEGRQALGKPAKEAAKTEGVHE